jgi:DNA-binding MarR family transcriptional regulator
LSEGQQEQWRAFVAVLTRLPSALDAQLQRDADLTHFAYWVLAMLSEAPGRALRMSELAARSNASPSRLSHVVAKLEQRGWVTREPVSGDARGNLARLTDAGHRKLVEAAAGHVDAVRSLVFDVLTPAQAEDLGRICAAILAGLEAGSPQRAP